MISTKCTMKFRDKTGKIMGYRLVDLNGQKQNIEPEILKAAIKNGQITVVNLTLTSDNRLVDTSDNKKYQQKKIDSVSVDEMHVKNRTRLMTKDNGHRVQMANAIVCINMQCADSTESIKSLTGRVCKAAGICTDYHDCDNRKLIRYQTKAFLKLMDTNKDYVKDFLYHRLTPNFAGFRRGIDQYLATKDLRGAEMIIGSLRLIKEYLERDFGESEYDRESLTVKISSFLIENENRVKLERALG